MQGRENGAHLVVVLGGVPAGAHVEGYGGSQGALCRSLTLALEITEQRAADNAQCHIVQGNAGGILDLLEGCQREFRGIEHPVRADRAVQDCFRCRDIGRRNLLAGDIQCILADGQGVAGGTTNQLQSILHAVHRGSRQQLSHARIGIHQAGCFFRFVIPVRICLQVMQGRHKGGAACAIDQGVVHFGVDGKTARREVGYVVQPLDNIGLPQRA